MRPNKHNYYLQMAKWAAIRSTCLRKHYGAVIVKDDEIISTGYNGSPDGCINCTDTGKCRRKEFNIPSGERYELCRSIHAEQNAIISASRHDMIGSTLYLYGYDVELCAEMIGPQPCLLCKKMLIRAGIDTIVTIGSNNEPIIEHVAGYKYDVNELK